MEILQHRIAKALQNHVFCKAPLKRRVCNECADFGMVAHTGLRNSSTMTRTRKTADPDEHIWLARSLHGEVSAFCIRLETSLEASTRKQCTYSTRELWNCKRKAG